MRLFAYGTLMFPEILDAVAGTVPMAGTPARLHGFSRRAVRGEAYPAIVPQPLAQVPGMLWSGLPETCLGRLDAFEGSEYRRQRRLLVTADGLRLTAWCYVLRDELRGTLAPHDWSCARFRSSYLDSYLLALRRRGGSP